MSRANHIKSKPSGVTGTLAAIAFVLVLPLLVFSLWAEWGIYAWLVSAQVSLTGTYFLKATFILTFIAFLVVGVLLSILMSRSVRSVRLLGFGIPALLVAAHFLATIYFLCTGGSTVDASTFQSAINNVSFLPQGINLELSKLPPLDTKQAVSINSSGAPDETYISVEAAGLSSELPVVLKATGTDIHSLSGKQSLKGTIQKAPLPYLVRVSSKKFDSLFAIVISEGGTVRGAWGLPTFIYAACLVGIPYVVKSYRNSLASR